MFFGKGPFPTWTTSGIWGKFANLAGYFPMGYPYWFGGY